MKVKYIYPNGDGTYAITTADGYHLPCVALSRTVLPATVTDFVVESDGSWTLDFDIPGLPTLKADLERDAKGVMVDLRP